MNTPIDEKRRAIAELGAMVATGGLFLFFENVLHLKLPFLAIATIGWTAYIVGRLRRETGLARDWGLWRREMLGPAVALHATIIALGALLLGAWRWRAGWVALPPSFALLLALYPLWAFIQQFVLQALGTRNLERLGVPGPVIVPLAALLFGIAHLPDWRLALLCAAAGLVFTAAYRSTRNLVPLAFAHAWLGALAYCWILERDPWLEMVPKVLDAVPKAG